jgi:hypothetical protein
MSLLPPLPRETGKFLALAARYNMVSRAGTAGDVSGAIRNMILISSKSMDPGQFAATRPKSAGGQVHGTIYRGNGVCYLT